MGCSAAIGGCVGCEGSTGGAGVCEHLYPRIFCMPKFEDV